jgi:hypothetical protein
MDSFGYEAHMNPFVLGIICGLAFAILDVLLMLPLEFPDKRTALTGAFASRFAIGFLIPMCRIPVPPFVAGAIVGVLISLPEAIITKSYGPILISGLIGGTIIGWVAGRFGANDAVLG